MTFRVVFPSGGGGGPCLNDKTRDVVEAGVLGRDIVQQFHSSRREGVGNAAARRCRWIGDFEIGGRYDLAPEVESELREEAGDVVHVADYVNMEEVPRRALEFLQSRAVHCFGIGRACKEW